MLRRYFIHAIEPVSYIEHSIKDVSNSPQSKSQATSIFFRKHNRKWVEVEALTTWTVFIPLSLSVSRFVLWTDGKTDNQFSDCMSRMFAAKCPRFIGITYETALIELAHHGLFKLNSLGSTLYWNDASTWDGLSIGLVQEVCWKRFSINILAERDRRGPRFMVEPGGWSFSMLFCFLSCSSWALCLNPQG